MWNRPVIGCAAIAFTLTSPARAEMIVHNNSHGEFAWDYVYDLGHYALNTLDITKGAAEQSDSGGLGFRINEGIGLSSGAPSWVWIEGSMYGAIAVDPEPVSVWQWDDFFLEHGAATFAEGDLISSVDTTYSSSIPLQITSGALNDGSVDQFFFVSIGDYVGVRFDIEGATHYGWIQLGWGQGFYQPLAWGYQSIAGEAAYIPALPTASWFAIAVSTARRRR